MLEGHGQQLQIISILEELCLTAPIAVLTWSSGRLVGAGMLAASSGGAVYSPSAGALYLLRMEMTVLTHKTMPPKWK